ncbi:hypothetical protein [Bacillus sp. AFS088145]|uniref:hypothetical protein n=1 Tax=Bacillus sp. AFS088145 TaxID=2033514 RepID=UPI002570EA6A|nr:hypothetical protein [Bacillus sp. AFS088145]
MTDWIFPIAGKRFEISFINIYNQKVFVVRDPISILDASIKEEVEAYVLPETKAAQIEHAIKHEISVRMKEDEVFYTSLKKKVEDLLEKFKER